MGFDEVVELMRQLGAALDAAHDKGVIHCDLKPENIMLQEVGGGKLQARVVDFGISKIKDSQVKASMDFTKISGTVRYMAPEQIEGKPSAATDIWALGVIADGALVYVAGPALTAKSLAESLQRAGAVRAMTLDINPEWVQLDVASRPGGPLQTAVPGQFRPADQYIYGWTRDFITVLAS